MLLNLSRKKPTTDPLDEIQKDIRALEIELALYAATYGSRAKL